MNKVNVRTLLVVIAVVLSFLALIGVGLGAIPEIPLAVFLGFLSLLI